MKQPGDTVTPELPVLDEDSGPWPFPSTIGNPGDGIPSSGLPVQDPASSELDRYQGGKNGAGVFQKIINCIPAHTIYVEPFAGSAAIYRRKTPAASSILIELDFDQAALLGRELPSATVVCGDGIRFMGRMVESDQRGTFLYIDPPYLHSTRKDTALYKHELKDERHEHLVTSLLPALTDRGALWALSGYSSELYNAAMRRFGWWCTAYQARTRRGTVTEMLWTNYDPAQIMPATLKFAGANFRERERMKRKAQRWTARLAKMPALEREFLKAALATLDKNGEA